MLFNLFYKLHIICCAAVFVIHVKSGFGIAIHMRIGLIQSNSKSLIYAFWKSKFHIPTGIGFQIFQFAFLFPRSQQQHSKIPKVWNAGFGGTGFGAYGNYFNQRWAFSLPRLNACLKSTQILSLPYSLNLRLSCLNFCLKFRKILCLPKPKPCLNQCLKRLS